METLYAKDIDLELKKLNELKNKMRKENKSLLRSQYVIDNYTLIEVDKPVQYGEIDFIYNFLILGIGPPHLLS